jgi:hypothetical protein
MTYVYVASSWRNPHQPEFIAMLRNNGIECYDFRNPEGGTGFAWSSIDPNWEAWSAKEYIRLLDHPLAVAGYKSDFDAMSKADAFVLILPSGRSAHLEAGWAAGSGRKLAILTQDGEEPELMAKMADLITDDPEDILDWLSNLIVHMAHFFDGYPLCMDQTVEGVFNTSRKESEVTCKDCTRHLEEMDLEI